MRAIDHFDRGHDLDPERRAIVDIDRGIELSFAEVRRLTFRIAAAMQRQGFKAQDVAALYGPNDGTLLVSLLAFWRANGRWVPVNARNAIEANAAFLDYVRCQWMFYHSSVSGSVAALRERCPTLREFVCVDRACNGDPSLEQFIAGVSESDFAEPAIDPFGNLFDFVGIMPTGGTTGPSKGTCVTNLGWSTMIETAAAELDRRTDDPIALVTAPLTHAAGVLAATMFNFGATQVILPGFEPDRVLQAIGDYRISHLYLPPTAMYQCLAHPDAGRFDYSSLRIFVLAGSVCSPEKLRQAVDMFGPVMCQSYGQTECPLIITWFPPEEVARFAREAPARLASCGRPSRTVRVALLDDDGRPVGPGESGEICTRSAMVSHSYFERPEETAEIRRHGWHHTGDIGRFDEQGYLYIVDRKKDMIVTGGFNVFTAEVEAALTAHPEVADAAVFGIPHDKWGEQVHAVVVAPGLTAEALIAHAKGLLGSVKAPKSVDFADAIPRTPNGKHDKKAMRQAYWGRAERMVN